MGAILNQSADIQQASQVEASLPPGTYDIRFYASQPQGQAGIQNIYDHLAAQGVQVHSVTEKQSGGYYITDVVYTKPAPSEAISALPVAIIPLIGLGLILALVGVGIFRLEDITNNLAKLLLILLGGTIVIVALLRKPIENATTVAVRRYGG